MSSVLKRNQMVVFATAWISYAVIYFLRKPIGIIKPVLESEFSLSKTDLGLMDVAFLLPYAAIQVFGGHLGDKLGPRLTIALCLSIGGTAMFTFGAWNRYSLLLLTMFINGITQGPCWPAICKAVCAWYPDQQLNSVIGVLSTSVYVGGAAGTALAVHLQYYYGWRMVFLPSAVVAVALGVVVYCVMQSPDEKHITVPGKESMITPKIGDDVANRRSFCQLWKIPAVPEVTMTVLCLKVVRYCMLLWLPIFLVHYLQYSVAQAGMFSTIFDVGGSLGSPLIGFILDRKFKKNTFLGMWLFVSISSISMALFAMTAKLGFFYNALFMLIAGASNGGADSLLAGSLSMKMGEANGMRSGAAVTGLINGVGTFGAVFEGPVVGYISDHYGWGAMLTLMIVLSAVSSLTMFRAMVVQRKADRYAIPHHGSSNSEDKVPLMS
ncbi:unnamed protein product [Orchesella dallaii]|uniref:Major facilitator superfamily (MFS) profile domain-containing protein n=1 Tax=Orchesella dallaii TaxID=48710 RepID=A0ABP1S4W4_9HEXA